MPLWVQRTSDVLRPSLVLGPETPRKLCPLYSVNFRCLVLGEPTIRPLYSVNFRCLVLGEPTIQLYSVSFVGDANRCVVLTSPLFLYQTALSPSYCLFVALKKTHLTKSLALSDRVPLKGVHSEPFARYVSSGIVLFHGRLGSPSSQKVNGDRNTQPTYSVLNVVESV